ncbi:hypothetical protein [Spirobacillus cienkowskii]|uniref:hypothetical protein n=1 Tax=Spirobacillus cienkowskii TaxID=495820 RepID=UPI0030CB2D70
MIFYKLLTCGLLLYSVNIFAVPLSFLLSESQNMPKAQWHQLESENFRIYYPKNALDIAKYSLYAAESSYSYLSLLLGVYLPNDSISQLESQKDRSILASTDKFVYILGNRAEGSGFANPVTLNIEAQMLFSRKASFFQHELVHRLMYEHNQFKIGPLGRIWSLAMLPAWWIEGLAEYLTESIGTIETDALERHMALQSNWPSWDRLHSLYNADEDAILKGYVVSGRFLGWLFSKTKQKDLYEIHKNIFSKTITFPFYNAIDAWVFENFQKDSKQLYIEFQNEKRDFWKNYINGLPELAYENEQFSSGHDIIFPTIVFENKAIFSRLVSNYSVYSGSFYVKDFSEKSETRIPFNYIGSSIFSASSLTDGVILTAVLNKYDNFTMGHDVSIIKFKNKLSEISEKNIIDNQILKLSSKENPILIKQIFNYLDNNFFIVAVQNGNTLIYHYDYKKNNIKFLKKFLFPETVKFINNYSNLNLQKNCGSFILFKDFEKTAIDNICADGNYFNLVKENYFIIKDAYILKNGIIRILAKRDKLLSLIDYTPKKQSSFRLLISEIIDSIVPWDPDPEKFLGAWVYKDNKYFFKKIDIYKSTENYKNWLKDKDDSDFLKSTQEFNDFKPRFVEIFNNKKEYFLIKDQEIISNYLKLTQEKSESDYHNFLFKENETEAFQKIADYNNRFLFAYPYAMPYFLGGPTIGLFSIPYMDEMERYYFQLFAGYNFYLDSFNASLTYVNNEIFNGLNISLFAEPFFNGYYLVNKSDNGEIKRYKYYNYLNKVGVSFLARRFFRPLSSNFESSLSVYQLLPFNSNDNTPPSDIGAQNALIINAAGELSFDIFNTGFYLTKTKQKYENWLLWRTRMSLGASKSYSIGKTKNSLGQNIDNLDFYNLNTNINSSIALFEHRFSIIGGVSTTQGKSLLNIKEIYSPFQNYILGSTTSLNFVSYPIYSNGTFLSLKTGSWSYYSSLIYDFPIFSKFEKKFLISFIDNLKGFVSLNHGGVSLQNNLSSWDSITSANIGSSIRVDIKGVQFFPTIIYSQAISQENNWSLLFQFKFSNFL